jgi:Putative heavy-metal chelation
MQTDPILTETIASVQAILGTDLDRITVERAVVGLFFTGVKLDTGVAGACATPLRSIAPDAASAHSAKSLKFGTTAQLQPNGTRPDGWHGKVVAPMILTQGDLELLKQLKAAGERGRNVRELNIRGTLDRLVKGGYLVARPTDAKFIQYRITQRGQDAIVEYDL